MLGHAVAQKGSAQIINSILSAQSNNIYLIKSVSNYLLPKSFSQVQKDFQEQFGVLVLGVRSGNTDQINPSAELVVQQSDTIIYLSDSPINESFVPKMSPDN